MFIFIKYIYTTVKNWGGLWQICVQWALFTINVLQFLSSNDLVTQKKFPSYAQRNFLLLNNLRIIYIFVCSYLCRDFPKYIHEKFEENQLQYCRKLRIIVLKSIAMLIYRWITLPDRKGFSQISPHPPMDNI